MKSLYVFTLIGFHAYFGYSQNNVVVIPCNLGARQIVNGQVSNFFSSIPTYNQRYGTYIIPASYTGDIAINYDNSICCGGQPSSLWDGVYNNNTHKTDFIKPAEFRWSGPSIYEKGFVHFDINGVSGCTYNKEVSSVAHPEDKEDASDFFYSYMKIKVPKKTTTYTTSYKSHYTDPCGNMHTYGSDGKVILVVGQAVPISISHYHQILNHATFNTPRFLNNNYFNICADGSTTSVFGMKLNDQGLRKKNLGVRIKGDTTDNEELYGKFSSLIYVGSDSIAVRYKHPSYIQESRAFL